MSRGTWKQEPEWAAPHAGTARRHAEEGTHFDFTQTCQKFRKPIDMVYIRVFNNLQRRRAAASDYIQSKLHQAHWDFHPKSNPW